MKVRTLAQHSTAQNKNLNACSIGFSSMYCPKAISHPLYNIMHLSMQFFLPVVHHSFIFLLSTSRTGWILKRGLLSVASWHLAAITKMKILLSKQESIPCHGFVDPCSLEAIRSLSPMSRN
jgi:hypothetical protein